MKPIFFLAWLLELIKKLFGGNPIDTKIKEIEANIKKCEDKLKTQQNKLKDLKQTIENTQEEILLKEKERDSQTGKIREITEKEILSLFKTFESTSGMRDLIFRNISSLQTVISKYKEYQTALISDIDGDELEALTFDLMNNVKELQQEDRALRRLETVGYSSNEQTADVDSKLAEIHAMTSKVTTAVKTTTEQAMPHYETPKQPTLPKLDMPEPQTMPSSSEVDALLKQLHEDSGPTQIEE